MKFKQFILCLMVIMAVFSSIKVIPNLANPDLDFATLSDVIDLDSTTIFEEVNMSIPFDENLVAYYSLNEGSGTTINDDTGYNHTGFYEVGTESTNWTTDGIEGYAIHLNETGQQILTFNDHDDFSFGNGTHDSSFSIEVWVRPYHDAERPVIRKANEWQIYLQTGNKVGFMLNDASEDQFYLETIDTFNFGDLIHIVCTYNGNSSAYGLNIYVNGSIESDYYKDRDYVAMENNANNVTVGYYSGISNQHKVIDEIRIWDKELNSTEVSQLYTDVYDAVNHSVYDNSFVGNWTGYLVNGSSSAYYNLNYTLDSDFVDTLNGTFVEHNHFFYFPHNYTFVNCTFGNGTFKTTEAGFDISVYNSTYDRMNFTDTSQVTGDWIWFFSTSNAITNFELNPDESNGTLNNISSVQFNIRMANGSVGIVGSPISVRVLLPDETVLTSVSSSTGANGWYNSSISQQFLHSPNNTYFMVATGLNDTFIGFMIKRFYGYNDWDAPVVNNIIYEDSLIEDVSFSLDVYVSDEYTLLADLTIRMDYSFVSSGTLTETSSLTQSGALYTVSLIGQTAGTTLWFQIIVIDNLSNSFESIVYQTDWEVAEEAVPSGGDGDSGDGVTPPAIQPTGGIPDVVLILLFGAGAVSVAVVGYAVLQRVQVRTRTVKTQEVITGLGVFGSAKEDIKVTGRKPTGRSKKAIKKARAKRKRK